MSGSARTPSAGASPLPRCWGPLGAQMELGVAAIGGKDSMSGSFEELDVPPTLVSFAVATGKTGEVVSPEFKAAGHKVCLLTPRLRRKRPARNRCPAGNLRYRHRPASQRQGRGRLHPRHGRRRRGRDEDGASATAWASPLTDALTLDELFGYAYGGLVLEDGGRHRAARFWASPPPTAASPIGGDSRCP